MTGVCVLCRERHLPNVSYDHREFIDGELVLRRELKMTWHLLPKSPKDGENRRYSVSVLSVCLSCMLTRYLQPNVEWNPSAVLYPISRHGALEHPNSSNQSNAHACCNQQSAGYNLWTFCGGFSASSLLLFISAIHLLVCECGLDHSSCAVQCAVIM